MGNLLNKVIALEREQQGYIEKASNKDLDSKTANKGTANFTKYSRDINNVGLMGCQGQPWCCSSQFWIDLECFGKEIALKLWNMTEKTYVGYNCFSTYNAFSKVGQVGKEPKVGALVIFTFSHAGRVLSIYTKNGKKYIECAEGNSSSNLTDNNGGMFNIRERGAYDSNIKGYCYIDYDSLDAPESISSLSSTPSDNLITHPIKTGQKRLTVRVDGYLNVRNFPSTGDVTTKLYNGDIVTPEKKTFIDDKAWFWIKECNGWCSASYLSGWIEESDGRWWYLDYGYQWKTGINEIDGSWYYFDKDGWLVTDDRIDIDNNTYFTRTDGSFFTNTWVDRDSKWYYVGNDGKVYKKRFFYDLEKEELYYLTDDGTMFEGELILHTNGKGVLSVG